MEQSDGGSGPEKESFTDERFKNDTRMAMILF